MDTEAELKKVPVWNEELKKYFGEFHDGEFVFMMTANGLKFTKEDLKKAYEQNQRLPLFRWGLNSVLDLCLSDVLDEKGKSIGIQLFPNAAEYLKKYVIIEQNKMPGEQTQHKQNQQVSYWIGLANAFQEQ
jgi:ribosomal protein L39E